MALIECPECHKQVSDQAPTCIHCGYPLPREKRLSDSNPHYGESPSYNDFGSAPPVMTVKAAKSRGIYIILALVFGFLGFHNFYAGYYGRGLVQLLLVLILGWFVIGFVIVFFWILVELFTVKQDGSGTPFA